MRLGLRMEKEQDQRRQVEISRALVDVQVVTRRLVEQAPHLDAGAGLAAMQQRLQTFTLGRQGSPIHFHDVTDADDIR